MWLGWTDGRTTCADRLRAPAKGEGWHGAWLTRRAGTSRPGRRTGGQTCKPTAQIERNPIKHCYVSDNFGFGVIIPLVRDKAGDVEDVNNNRGITLSSTGQNCLSIVFYTSKLITVYQ